MTRSTTSFEFGEVVVVAVPFTDQSATKKRPAVVVSNRRYNEACRDVVLVAVTSRVRTPLAYGELLLQSWQDAGLIKPSVVKPVFATFEQDAILLRLGRLVAQEADGLAAVVRSLLG